MTSYEKSGVDLNWSPAKANITVTQGDLSEVWSVELLRDDVPIVPTERIAQVRTHKNRSSALLLDLEPTSSGNVVTFPSVEIDVTPGTYYWDLQVDNLTVLSGTYRVLADVSNEEE